MAWWDSWYKPKTTSPASNNGMGTVTRPNLANTWKTITSTFNNLKTQATRNTNSPTAYVNRYGSQQPGTKSVWQTPQLTNLANAARNNLTRNYNPQGLASRYGAMQPGTTVWKTPQVNTDVTRNYNPTGLINRYGTQQPGTKNPWADAFVSTPRYNKIPAVTNDEMRMFNNTALRSNDQGNPEMRWFNNLNQRTIYGSMADVPNTSQDISNSGGYGGWGGGGGYGGWGGGGGGSYGGGGGYQDVKNWYANMVQWNIKG